MSNEQLYISIGVPSVIAIVGVLVNVSLFIHLSNVMRHGFDKTDTRIETLTGKVIDIDNRVIRIEDKLGIVPR